MIALAVIAAGVLLVLLMEAGHRARRREFLTRLLRIVERP